MIYETVVEMLVVVAGLPRALKHRLSLAISGAIWKSRVQPQSCLARSAAMAPSAILVESLILPVWVVISMSRPLAGCCLSEVWERMQIYAASLAQFA